MRRIDYRVQHWGHAVTLRRTEETIGDSPVFKGHCFHRGLSEGDELVVPMGSGRAAVFIATKVESLADPGDMHFIEAYPDHYLDEEAKA